ncbi:MAG: crossover junction endodeoxyribonuclease RuvC [Deltaproteobacteria bacterium]|nr:crossover junction endodeoxyribonuclease RuvC [Deltaproteobacteria bacterium]
MISHIKAIGVDPGLASTGFAVVEILERGGRACHWGDIKTSPKLTFSERLDSIYYQLSEVISCWHPQLLVMEDVFVYKKYPKAAIQLGTVKGVVYLAAQHKKINVCEIKPTELKSALTGRASKKQVEKMTRKILNVKEPIKSDHVSDAMALAIIGLSRNGIFRW